MIDQDVCIGCHACTVACKTEHEVPLGVNRTWVKYVEKGEWPHTRRFFSVMRCNHCTDAPCVTICPTRALFTRDDGIVDFDTDRCIGCKSCMQACPYDALYIDPDENTAQKCNYCVHRVEAGIEPACVVVCPEQAIIAGDLDDPTSRIARLVATEQLFVRSPEQNTGPNLFYKGVEEANIDPLAARPMTDGGLWSTPSGVSPNGDGPARVTYDTSHPMPWGWRVSAYFLTKGVAAGLVLAAAVALLAGADAGASWHRWGVPLWAGVFLAVTGVLLVSDLKRPDRFLYLLTKSNPDSWLVRGAWILGAYAAVLALWFVAGIADAGGLVAGLTWVAVPLALATAGYTAFLFGQAEARDLWQSPVLLWHMLAGAFAVGGGAALVTSVVLEVAPAAERAFGWTTAAGAAALGLLALAELASRHPTRNIGAAVHQMTRGVYARQWWIGGQLVGVVVPFVVGGAVGADWIAAEVGALAGIAAAAGLYLADDAFVKAGQSVPLS